MGHSTENTMMLFSPGVKGGATKGIEVSGEDTNKWVRGGRLKIQRNHENYRTAQHNETISSTMQPVLQVHVSVVDAMGHHYTTWCWLVGGWWCPHPSCHQHHTAHTAGNRNIPSGLAWALGYLYCDSPCLVMHAVTHLPGHATRD